MSSRSYSGRHRAPGRHRASRTKRLPRAFTPAFALPTAAAATLVLTTTGATMAGSAPVEIQTNVIDLALAQSQVSESRSDTEALAERRTETTDQTSLLQGRQQEADRVAREKERLALKKKKEAAAKAKAEAEARKKAQNWVFPAGGGRSTSGYGWRWGRMHNGIDVAGPVGTPIYAASSGTVIKVSSSGSCGRQIYIEHWNGEVTRYCHLNTIGVSEGERVGPGQTIGGMGNTGRSTGPHLHFEVYPSGIDGQTTNPTPWLNAKGL